MAGFARFFLREAALGPALFAIAVQLAAAFYAPLTVDLQAELNAAVVAATGLATCLLVAHERLPAAMLGLAQAGLALALGLGLQMSPYAQAAVMTAITAATAAFIRTQVTARVPSTEYGSSRSVGVTDKTFPVPTRHALRN